MNKTALCFLSFALAVRASAAGCPDEPKAVTSMPPVMPVSLATNAAGHVVADFARHAFGWLEVDVVATGRYEIVWGELLNDDRAVETNRFYTFDRGCVRCACSTGVFERVGVQRIPLQDGNGSSFYQGAWNEFLVPGKYGNVMPFRWAEVVRAPFPVRPETLRQVAVRYPFDLAESHFASSSPALDRVVDFCKYSVAATSFLGRFIDGDRERLTYEADSLIAQLGSYAMSSDYAPARTTLDWVSDHSTWPTEWKQHFVRMCWLDWMHTGDASRIRRYYDAMRTRKLWSKCARADGLLVTEWRKAGTDDTPRDIVDWPMSYRDGFVFTSVNAVVNALRYRNLLDMRDMAAALGKTEDADSFAKEACRVQSAFVKTFLDPKTGLVHDGEGTDHVTVHGNAMALACGVLPPDRVAAVADYVVRKGLSCSTYMAQFVLEGLCRAGRVEAALKLMTGEGRRGWLAMMDKGATITMEFWDQTLVEQWRKPDMSHAWSTAPLNVVTRFILGVTPLEPGFSRIGLAPRLGSLTRIDARVPTQKGCVAMRIDKCGESWTVALDLPAPTTFDFEGAVRDLPAGHHDLRVPVAAQAAVPPSAEHYRPKFHFTLPENGDPGDSNGAFWRDGRYHLMFLYRKGDVCSWGHVSSLDMFSWQRHADAIGPSPKSPGGCYSGGAFVDDDGRAYLTYWMLKGPIGLGMAASEGDYTVWKNLPENPIIRSTHWGWTLDKDEKGNEVKYASADPSNVWKKDGKYYLIAGNLCLLNDNGRATDSPESMKGDCAYLFESPDLKHWKYLHPFYQRKVGETRETGWTDADEDCMCPSFLPLPAATGKPSGKHLLLFISHNRGCQYYIGRYDTANDRFVPESHGRMTWQDKAYFAPEAMIDGKGRQLVWTWMMDNPENDMKRFGWSGVYSMPRSLWLADDGTLGLAPVEEVKALRRGERDFGTVDLVRGKSLAVEGVTGDCCEVELRLDGSSAHNFALEVKAAATGSDRTVIRLDRERGELVFDASGSNAEAVKDFCNHVPIERAPFRLKPGEELRLRVFVDGPMVEVCANDRQMITRRVYVSDAASTRIRLVAAAGDVRQAHVKAWSLSGDPVFDQSNCQFSLPQVLSRSMPRQANAKRGWIQQAIDAAAAKGGGRVTVPAGVHETGTIWLRSGVELHLEKGAVLSASTRHEDYDQFPREICPITPEFSDKALICAANAEDISITGEGVVDGNGPSFYDTTKFVCGVRPFWRVPDLPRPRLVQFVNCRRTRISGVTFRDAAAFTMYVRGCEDFAVDHVAVVGDRRITNNDGIDVDGCRRVRIGDSVFNTGDDCIAIRAVRALNDLSRQVVCEDVVISNCTFSSACQAIRIGCPSDDTIRNVVFRNIDMTGSNNGIYFGNHLYCVRRTDEGFLDATDILFENICGTLTGRPMQILVDDGIGLRRIDRVTFRNIDVRGADARFRTTVRTPFGDVRYENVKVNGKSQPDGQVPIANVSSAPFVRSPPLTWEN